MGEAGPPGEAGTPARNYYLTAPGVALAIQDVAIDKQVVKVTFRVTDPSGLPLDREGLYTEGTITTGFALGWLEVRADGTADHYTSYTTRQQTSTINGTVAEQAWDDVGGTYDDVDPIDGVYSYTFSTKVDVQNPGKTHTLAAWATRDFEGERYVANATHHFLPAGGPPTVKRDVVQLQACNSCHNPLEAHEGLRREVEQCVVCHTPQTTDPDTGNVLDFKVMVHKIHRGENLVLGYKVIGDPLVPGDPAKEYDFSHTTYPQGLQHCDACHTGSQGPNWKLFPPTRALCTTCHDGISFDDNPQPPLVAHSVWSGQSFPDDTQCAVCHTPPGATGGQLLPVVGTHLLPSYDTAAPKMSFSNLGVTHAALGELPQITFTLEKNGQPAAVTDFTSIVVTVAGPTTDYAEYWQETIQGTGAGTGLVDLGGGNYRYTMTQAMKAKYGGTYAFGLEGYATGPKGERYAALNQIAYGKVTDSVAVERRTVVARNQCNGCHFDLSAHGGARNDPQYCVMCHNGNKANDQRAPRTEGPPVLAQSVHFPMMIHRIHMGNKLAQGYTLGGYPGPSAAIPQGWPQDFGDVTFPGDRSSCPTCHAKGPTNVPTYVLPLPAGAISSMQELLVCNDVGQDPTAYCVNRDPNPIKSLIPAITAACTGCHDKPSAIAHAHTMTDWTADPPGEACETCHGPGADYDVQRVHHPKP